PIGGETFDFSAAQEATQEIEQHITIRRGSTAELDLSQLPKGSMTAEVEAPTGVGLVGIAVHFGPNGQASASPAFNRTAVTAIRGQLAASDSSDLALLFRRDAFDSNYSSTIRIANAAQGAMTP